jgi:predicted RNA-binding Zn ribbon-like protein
MDLIAARPGDETLLLDLLNTTPVVDGVPRDELDDPKTALSWLRSHGIAAASTQVQDLIAVRTALQAVVRGHQTPATLQPLLKGVCLFPKITDDGLAWTLAAGGTSEAAVRAILAWDALRISSPGRLRPCANPECRRFFIDRSKPSNGRWCSMAICGNRMKARRHYQRTKATAGD